VETAAATLRDLRVGEIVKLDMTVDDGKVTMYRARVDVSFKVGTERPTLEFGYAGVAGPEHVACLGRAILCAYVI